MRKANQSEPPVNLTRLPGNVARLRTKSSRRFGRSHCRQEQEDQCVADEQEWDVKRWNIYARGKQARIAHLRDTHIVGIEQVQCAPHVEYPDDGNGGCHPPGEGGHREKRESGRDEIAPCDLARENGAQIRGHKPRDHEIHSEEPERIEGGKEPQRVVEACPRLLRNEPTGSGWVGQAASRPSLEREWIVKNRTIWRAWRCTAGAREPVPQYEG